MKFIAKYILVSFFLCSCSTLSQGTVPNGYEKNLQEVMQQLISGKELNVEQIQNAIPKTEGDFIVFYSYTKKDEKSNTAFYTLNNLILKYAMNGESSIFKSFLLLSEFVDGEYAESYFEDVEAVIEKNKETFCKLFPQLPKKKVKRLLDLYDRYCK